MAGNAKRLLTIPMTILEAVMSLMIPISQGCQAQCICRLQCKDNYATDTESGVDGSPEKTFDGQDSDRLNSNDINNKPLFDLRVWFLANFYSLIDMITCSGRDGDRPRTKPMKYARVNETGVSWPSPARWLLSRGVDTVE